MKKERLNNPKVIGGVGNRWGKQFKQQSRVLDRKHVSYAVNAAGFNGLYVKKWKRES